MVGRLNRDIDAVLNGAPVDLAARVPRDGRPLLDRDRSLRIAFEVRTRLGELLERVSRGQEVVITRHDKEVARLVPEGP